MEMPGLTVSREVAIPSHIAIIMDGNGRWAAKRGHSRVFGHVRGANRVRSIVEEASRLGVKALTLFAFSTENWERPSSEVRLLWQLFKRYLTREVDALNRAGVKLQVIGEIERLDPSLQNLIQEVIDKLSKNTTLTLTLAISYGGRKEIQQAARRFAEDCVAGRVTPAAMEDPHCLERYLWTKHLGPHSDVDLLIRTSGERRLSNFLLWQNAYSEFVFSDVCWPDFGPDQLRRCIDEYRGRDRRFGQLKEGVA